jgi:hypothetical protein
MPADPEDLVIYRSLGFVDDWPRRDVPDFADDHPALLAQCRAALARREAAYPAMVVKGEVTEAQAKADLAGWRDLVREWHWIETGEGQPPHPVTMSRRLAALDLAQTRIEAELPRAGSAQRADLEYQQALTQALRWHLQRPLYGAPAIHFWAGCNHQLRQRARTQTIAFCGTCERRREDPATHACTRTDCGLPRPAGPAEAQERTAA